MNRPLRRWLLGGVTALTCGAVALCAGAAVYGHHVLKASLPQLDGPVPLEGLASTVQVTRDAGGVPTVTAANRLDLARALGFLHGQERFFEMDLMRRAGAGELSGLVGKAAIPLDRQRRLHRFRAHAERLLALQDRETRDLLAAYADGVNAGLRALAHNPFEYAILRAQPQPWDPLDSLLVVYAMYFDLQSDNGDGQALRTALSDRLGPEMAAFLDPRATPLDAPVDGTVIAAPPMPAHALHPVGAHSGTTLPPEGEHGSNNFAVAGKLTGTGAAMVANDMHLALGVPNIWYRARQIVQPEGLPPTLDLNGVTLPGTPFQVVGSNGHIAWAFTDAYIETGDLIRLSTLPPVRAGGPWRYRTPEGVREVEVVEEPLCPLRSRCTNERIEQTVWGPVSGRDAHGNPLVWRWSAEDDNAVEMHGFTELEGARTVRAALDAAHRTALPQENMLVGDSNGHIGWTVIGPVPRRVGLEDELVHDWSDGTHRWDGYLAAADIPEIIDPPSGRLWTANGRVVGGSALSAIGDGGYADGLRAHRIRDDLFAKDAFSERDFLAIQTDAHAELIAPWQSLLMRALARHAQDGDLASLTQPVRDWGAEALPESVGYRLVHTYRALAISTIFGAWAAGTEHDGGQARRAPPRTAWAIEKMLTERPDGLVPPGYTSWDETEDALLKSLSAQVARAGGAGAFTWGSVNHAGIHHPLARAVPLLGRLTDPPDVAEAGDVMVPRVQVPGFGASERLVVSPGREGNALFEMPMGQSDNPLSPYYGAGQDAWLRGEARPLLPGPAVTKLVLLPRG